MADKKTPVITEQGIVYAKLEDGTIQLTFNIPYDKIKKARDEATKEIAKNATLPGFRKGHAPIDKVMEATDNNTLLEKTLSKILPDYLTNAIKKHNLKLAIYPKFELVSAKEDEDWQIRAVTCELPVVTTGDYKKAVLSKKPESAIWTPGKDKKEKIPTREEKEQIVFKALLDSIDIKIPKILIDDEVNSRLSGLLERIEKLGLNLESYLASLGKTAETLRKEYENAAIESLKLDLFLTDIAKRENVEVNKEEVDAAMNATNETGINPDFDSPERRQFVEVILKRRKVLDSLLALI